MKHSPVRQQCFDLLKAHEELYTASSRGIQKVVGGSVININDSIRNSVFALHQYKKYPEYIFVGLNAGLGAIKRLDNNVYDIVGDKRIGEFRDGIWSIAEDEKGRVWLGTENDDISKAANWSDYVYANKGVEYMKENGSPASHWIAKINNSKKTNCSNKRR